MNRVRIHWRGCKLELPEEIALFLLIKVLLHFHNTSV